MTYVTGLLCALGAAFAFGVQYVPVKKYEIFDGVTFQWFMCAGILMVGFVSSLIFGNFGMANHECLLIIEGGALWALSNYLVLPVVKLLGIGPGFSLYHFVNLVVGYVIGRFGIFGMESLRGNVKVCDAGCGLVLISFILMVFVESEEAPKGATTAEGDQGFREDYQRWRQDHVKARRPSVMEAAGSVLVSYSTAEPGGHLHSVGGFSVLQPPRLVGLSHAAAADAATSAVAEENGGASWELPPPALRTQWLLGKTRPSAPSCKLRRATRSRPLSQAEPARSASASLWRCSRAASRVCRACRRRCTTRSTRARPRRTSSSRNAWAYTSVAVLSTCCTPRWPSLQVGGFRTRPFGPPTPAAASGP
ncbi:TMEM144 [Symbiodinium natans]|uniref:TMEM144 protein n=1 Tax=Symbiodinium natans TaxID=878477 RepID=A0A812QTM6_9DINO|nr:TMEM144 [Symbiodinium natans]